MSLRPDGSIVPTDNAASRHFPSVREWTPVASEGDAEKSVLASEAEVCDMAYESDLSHSGHNGVERLSNKFSLSYKSFFEIIYLSKI